MMTSPVTTVNCRLKSPNYSLTIEIVCFVTHPVCIRWQHCWSCCGVYPKLDWAEWGEGGWVSSDRADSVIRTHWIDGVLQHLCDVRAEFWCHQNTPNLHTKLASFNITLCDTILRAIVLLSGYIIGIGVVIVIVIGTHYCHWRAHR